MRLPPPLLSPPTTRGHILRIFDFWPRELQTECPKGLSLALLWEQLVILTKEEVTHHFIPTARTCGKTGVIRKFPDKEERSVLGCHVPSAHGWIMFNALGNSLDIIGQETTNLLQLDTRRDSPSWVEGTQPPLMKTVRNTEPLCATHCLICIIIPDNDPLSWLLWYPHFTDGETEALVTQLGKWRCCVGHQKAPLGIFPSGVQRDLPLTHSSEGGTACKLAGLRATACGPRLGQGTVSVPQI